MKFDSYCALGPAEGGCLDQKPQTPGQLRLLDSTTHVVVPVNTLVTVSVTAQPTDPTSTFCNIELVNVM